jgi:hypothetical protein
MQDSKTPFGSSKFLWACKKIYLKIIWNSSTCSQGLPALYTGFLAHNNDNSNVKQPMPQQDFKLQR